MKKHFYKNDIIKVCENNHLNVDEIYKKIIKIHPEAGKSSIYRNVEQLVDSGELKKLKWVWNKSIYEKTCEDHAHIICEKTWKIHDIKLCTNSISNLPENFDINKVDLKIYGSFKT